MAKGKEGLIVILVFILLNLIVVSGYDENLDSYIFSDCSLISENVSLEDVSDIVVEGASFNGYEGKECFSHSSYSDGAYAVCEICGDIIASDSGTGDYVDIYCEQGDLYISPSRYDPCDKNGCTGTLVSGTSEQNPYRYYFNSQEDEFLALCYDKEYINEYTWAWAARMVQYRNSIKVNLYPDFLNDEKYTKAEQVNYSEVFPPDLIANISIGKMALFGDYFEESENANLPLNVEFLKNRYSAGYLIKSPISEVSSNCEGNCQVHIIEDDAKEIEQGELISCEVEIQNSDLREVKSNRIEMPSFDLSIADLEFVNVNYLAEPTDESPDYNEIPILVREKPFFVKICLDYNSNLDNLDYMDTPVDLFLRFNQEHEIDLDEYVIGPKYISKENLRMEVEDSIIFEGNINEVKEELSRLEKIKQGTDCFYKAGLIQEKIASEGIYWYEIGVDPNNEIRESDEDDNYKKGAIFSPESKFLHIVYIPVVLEDSETGEMLPLKEWEATDPDVGVIASGTQQQTIKRGAASVKVGYELMRRAFPISDKNLKFYAPSLGGELLEEKIIPLKIQVKDLSELSAPVTIFEWIVEHPGEDFDEENYEQGKKKAAEKAGKVRAKIINKLDEYGKDFGEVKGREDVEIIAVGIVPKQVLYNERDGGLSTPQGMAFSWKDSVLVTYRSDYQTVVHEIGHLAGLYVGNEPEQYNLVKPWGDISDDGACLDPETGFSCGNFWGGRIVNIWEETSNNAQMRYSLEDVWEREDLISEENLDIIRKQINMGKRYFDFMGTASGYKGNNNVWPKLSSYKKLAIKYTNWDPV
jgi:hypothetical protein